MAVRSRSVDDGENVLLGQEHELIAAELDVGACVLAVEDFVADAHFRRLARTVVVALTRANLNDFAHLGLFFSGVGEQDAAGGFLLGF